MPALDFSLGIPARHKTALVYVVKASSVPEVELAMQNMELSFLNNIIFNKNVPASNDNLVAIYLSGSQDFKVVASEVFCIRRLQAKYGSDRFLLFHRNHLLNNWGEKWGAYQDLFCYLNQGLCYPAHYLSNQTIGNINYNRDPKQAFFSFQPALIQNSIVTKTEAESGIIGNIKQLNAGKTLVVNAIICDSDNIWPEQTVKKTIAKMAHPDNQKYALFQPLIHISNANDSLYTALKARHQPISQLEILSKWKVHRRSTFFGKGAIRIKDYFANIIQKQILSPDTKSHDFQEALYLPCALLVDISILEKSPANYLSDIKKYFRWTLGDIQGLIRHNIFWHLLDQVMHFKLPPFKYLWRFTCISMRQRYLLEHIQKAVLSDLIFAGWLLATSLALITPGIITISPPGEIILFILFLLMLFISVLMPQIVIPLLLALRQKPASLYAIVIEVLKGTIDAALSTLIFLQNLVYHVLNVIKSWAIIYWRNTIAWEAMAVIEHKNRHLSIWQYLFRLRYSIITGLVFLYFMDKQLYPHPIYWNLFFIFILALLAGPIISYFSSHNHKIQFYFKPALWLSGIVAVALLFKPAIQISGLGNVLYQNFFPKSNHVLLLDDFNESSFFNKLQGKMGTNGQEAATCSMDFEYISKLLHNNYALKLDYSLPHKGDFAFFWTKLGKEDYWNSMSSQLLDLSSYNYLSFWIKGPIHQELRLEIHEDGNADRIFQLAQDISAYVPIQRYLLAERNGWRKIVIPLKDFHQIHNWKNILEVSIIMVNTSNKKVQGTIFIDDILFGSNYSWLSEMCSFLTAAWQPIVVNSKMLQDSYVFDSKQNQLSINLSNKPSPALEQIRFEISMDQGSSWDPLGCDYNHADSAYSIVWKPNLIAQQENCLIRAVANDIAGNQTIISPLIHSCTIPPLTDEEFLDLIERKAFDYFWENQSPITGLFADASWGGDASIAVTGFGLTALCIGAERGWVDKTEVQKRTLLCLNTFLKNLKDKNDIYADGRFGFFYHFLDMNNAHKRGNCWVSTIDTALLLCGILTVGEYFGKEVKILSQQIFQNCEWIKFLNQDRCSKNYNLFSIGWSEDNFKNFYWDYYTDETVIINLLAIGSPTCSINPDVFYTWKREKGCYKNGKPIICSWFGSLFAYQYAHAWFDFRNKVDCQGIDWWQNSIDATIANRQFCIDNSLLYKSYGENSWGITGFYIPNQYPMHYGSEPCAPGVKPIHNGTVSSSGPAGSMVFTPIDSLDSLKHFYSCFPELWGKYGFKDSINLDEGWVSPYYFGLGSGISLLMIENFQTSLIWKVFMKNRYIKNSFNHFKTKSSLIE